LNNVATFLSISAKVVKLLAEYDPAQLASPAKTLALCIPFSFERASLLERFGQEI
jgi:hypothetical protein